MKKLYFLLLSLLITSVSYGQLINEFEPNPAGADPATVSIEIKGTPSASYSGFVLSIESDAGSPGIVDRVHAISGTFDANGLLLVTDMPDLENPSLTLVLVDTFSGTIGVTDIDTDDDGTVDDTSTFGTVRDAIGTPDNAGDEAFIYGVQLGGSDFSYTGSEPIIIFRDGTNDDLYAVNGDLSIADIDANVVLAGDFDTDPSAGTTFGLVNPSNLTASVDDINQKSFSVYPNPTNTGSVSVVSTNISNIGNINVAVFDVLGKQVINTMMSSETLDVSSLNTGVYIMKITQGNATSTKKLVVK